MNIINILKENKIKLITYFVFLFASIGLVTYATWTAPSAIPPENNTPTPLNVSDTAQLKIGSLGVTNGISTYDSVVDINTIETGTLCLENGSDCISAFSALSPWQTNTYGIYYNESGKNVAIGAAAVAGDNRLQVTGNTLISGKLTVDTIDPVYWIEGVSYSTYGHFTTGINEETMGKVELSNYSNGKYSYLIDFDHEKEGSDLWLFKQIIALDNEWNDLVVSLSPEGRGEVWYEFNVEENQIIFYGTNQIKVSYRLVAPRFDKEKRNGNYSDILDQNVGLWVR